MRGLLCMRRSRTSSMLSSSPFSFITYAINVGSIHSHLFNDDDQTIVITWQSLSAVSFGIQVMNLDLKPSARYISFSTIASPRQLSVFSSSCHFRMKFMAFLVFGLPFE